jgi:hypothetical protein
MCQIDKLYNTDELWRALGKKVSCRYEHWAKVSTVEGSVFEIHSLLIKTTKIKFENLAQNNFRVISFYLVPSHKNINNYSCKLQL